MSGISKRPSDVLRSNPFNSELINRKSGKGGLDKKRNHTQADWSTHESLKDQPSLDRLDVREHEGAAQGML
jgi:hypothetical protein